MVLAAARAAEPVEARAAEPVEARAAELVEARAAELVEARAAELVEARAAEPVGAWAAEPVEARAAASVEAWAAAPVEAQGAGAAAARETRRSSPTASASARVISWCSSDRRIFFVSSVFVANTSSWSAAVMSVPKSGGSVTTLVTNANLNGYLASDGTSLYFAATDSNSGLTEIDKAGLDGSNVTPLATGLKDVPLAFLLTVIEPRPLSEFIHHSCTSFR